MADWVVVPTRNLHAIPDGVGDREAVFIEPLAAAFRIVEQIPLGSGTTMAVLGARLSSVIWLSISTGGGRNSHSVMPRPSAVVQENHTPSTPTRIISQASNRRLNISLAPASTSTSSGTGGSSKALRKGFQLWMPSV